MDSSSSVSTPFYPGSSVKYHQPPACTLTVTTVEVSELKTPPGEPYNLRPARSKGKSHSATPLALTRPQLQKKLSFAESAADIYKCKLEEKEQEIANLREMIEQQKKTMKSMKLEVRTLKRIIRKGSSSQWHQRYLKLLKEYNKVVERTKESASYEESSSASSSDRDSQNFSDYSGDISD